MAFVNYNSKEITVKIVYYGPALSGKTTCLKYIYTSKKFEKKGKLITLDTDGDRTLFFDFLPIEIGKMGDYSVKMQLYTVPGQVAYDTTRKLVLQGADGVAFVADTQAVMREQNIESFENLKVNLELNNISYSDIPIILLYNKRDLREILPIETLNRDLNQEARPYFSTVAVNGENIIESLHEIMKLVIIYLKNRLSIFQKDKTVMFQRDEAVAKKIVPDTDIEEDSDKEVMELYSPIMEEEPVEDAGMGDEDIFNLGDDNILSSEEADIFAPELGAPPAKEAPRPTPPVRPKRETAAYRAVDEGIMTKKPAQIKKIDIPIDIVIPEDEDEIKVNVNLQIIVKKK
ncbi:MAG: GTPase domain-containing protein [Candidatus Aminicenantes bacterium]|nr:GTPase domain-containing protein [Candidatus Aminicenantes bacterium]